MPAADQRPLIVHVVFRLGVGGLENGVINLVNNLPRERYRHAIVALTEITDFRNRITRPDVRVHAIGRRAGNDVGALLRLYRLFRDLRPALVHTRNLGCLEAQIPAWLARVPYRVHGEHGWDSYDPGGQVRKYQLLRRVHAPLVQRFIPLSRELERYLVERVGIAPRKMRRIYNGVDTRRFGADGPHALPAGFRDDASFVIGTVGRMHGVKHQTLLAEAFVRLAGELPAHRDRLRLAMVGDGPLRADCMAILEQAGLAEQAWLPGARDEVAAVMRGFDLFVLPSLAEGISNTILEAMSCGLPVVATDVGGNGELVAADSTGTLVPSDDSAALATALAAYVADPALCATRGAAARARIDRDFSLDRMLHAYAAVYDEFIGEGR